MIESMMTPMATEQEDEYAGEMDSHSSMLCEVIKNQGRLEAKLDMLLAAEKEDEDEANDGYLALPSGSGGGSGSSGHLTYDGTLPGLTFDGF